MKTKKLLFAVCLIGALIVETSFAQNMSGGLIAFKTKNSNPYLLELPKGASLPSSSSFKASIGNIFFYMIRRDRVSSEAIEEAANYFQTKATYYQLGALSFVGFNLASLSINQSKSRKQLEARTLSPEARQLIADITAAKNK